MKRYKNTMDFDNIKHKLLEFFHNNITFIMFYISLLVIDLMLRLITMGTPVYFNALLADSMFILLLSVFAYLFKQKARYIFYVFWLLFFSALAIGNTIYYEFYKSFISVNLIDTASMIGQVNDALFDKIKLHQFVYLLIPIAFIIIYRILNKNNLLVEEYSNEASKKKVRYIFVAALVFLLFTLTNFTKSDASRFQKPWNREYIVNKYGMYIYTANDLVQSLQPKLNILYGYDDAALEFKEFYACEFQEQPSTNEYTNKFQGKNVLFIHMESIQNFLVDLKINGKEVTPNLNKIVDEGIYFNKFYPQISVGTSSDTEFTLLTGLMPSSSGTVFVNYFDREYPSLPKYFNDLGYYTFSTHANNKTYWNRNIMHENLGYNDFYAMDTYDIPEEDDEDFVGLGLSDKSFFKQFIPKLKKIKEENSLYYGTVITLSNHSPFNDIAKYGEFDVTMKYKYKNKKGETITDNAPYLEGTSMGNYIKSSHYADEALGELFKMLKEENLLENTVVILYGDHEARLSKKQFDLLYNYDPKTNSIKDEDEEDYVSMDNYYYDLLKNTPFIIWSAEEEYNMVVDKTMGMYDVLPTMANLFGFTESYALGHDVFSKEEGIVVFPSGNVLTDKVYYNNLNEEYISFTEDPLSEDYISNLRDYADMILEVSNGIIMHDLIKNEKNNLGECNNEKKTKVKSR